MKNKIAKILRDNLIYCDCFVSEKGYDDVINSTTDLITEMFAEYEKQVRVDELELLDIIAFRDETYKQPNSTKIVLYGHILNRIKELKEKL